MEIIVYKKGSNLIPLDEYQEYLYKLENGFYKIQIEKERNIGHHRKFFAILKVWAEYKNLALEEALVVLKILLGEVQMVEYEGREITILKSINFERMDEVEFTDFYNKALTFISAEMGVSKEELEGGQI